MLGIQNWDITLQANIGWERYVKHLAYMQGAIPLPVLILPIVLVNLFYAGAYALLYKRRRDAAVAAATSIRFLSSFVLSSFAFDLLGLSDSAVMKGIWLPMSCPQLITGLLGGGIIVFVIRPRLEQAKRI